MSPLAGVEPGLYVGQAHDDDGDIAMALLVDGNSVTGYACPLDVQRTPYGGFWRGEVAGSGTSATSPNGWKVDATWSGDRAAGTLTDPTGTPLQWSATRVSEDPLTGLYASDETDGSAGVIVVASDPPTSVVTHGALFGAEHRVFQVVPVLPVALTDGRLPVDVVLPGGMKRIYVTPVRAGAP